MNTSPRIALLRAAFAVVLALAGCVGPHRVSTSQAEVKFVDIGNGISLRSMTVRALRPRGTVLLLHGFPETLHAWDDVALALGEEFDVHAFDWPGYGLSSRPPASRFSYAPRDYADILRAYVAKAAIDRSTLVIYATDIGSLPALLLALEQPDIAKTIVVGDFAPFDRPQYMYPSLQSLKEPATADAGRAHLNRTRDEILANAFGRGLQPGEQFDVPRPFQEDMARGWNHGDLTTADAFSHYYSHFTRDQNHLEFQLHRLQTPLVVVWGDKDIYIDRAMGIEFAHRVRANLHLLPGIGHYPHLQDPKHTVEQIRAAFGRR